MMDYEAQQVSQLAQEVLGTNFVYLTTNHLELTEDFLSKTASIQATLCQRVSGEEKSFVVSGSGVGLVDAFFEGLLHAFSGEYVSLNQVAILDFSLTTKLSSLKDSHTDAIVTATLRVRNSDRHEYTFSYHSSSVSQSSIGVIDDVTQFFINSERAYTQLYFALQDAKQRSRTDLIDRYQIQMATLLKATSYKEIVQRLQTT